MVGWFNVTIDSVLIVDKITDSAVTSHYKRVGCTSRPKGVGRIRYDRTTKRRFFVKDGTKYFLDRMFKGD